MHINRVANTSTCMQAHVFSFEEEGLLGQCRDETCRELDKRNFDSGEAWVRLLLRYPISRHMEGTNYQENSWSLPKRHDFSVCRLILL